MRPTVDEQLDGAMRLLDAVAREETLSASGQDRLRDAGRLLRRVRSSWSTTLLFLLGDNAALHQLLGELGADLAPEPDPGVDVAQAAAANDRLRQHLSAAIQALPAPPDGQDQRDRIGRYLQRRVDTDPT